MVFVPPKDRVLEHSATAGTGPYALAGAVDTSYNAFSASMAVGDTTIGAIIEPGVAFASGILTYSAANQITLTTTKESKGTFGSGTKEIMMGLPASSALMVDGDQSLSATAKTQLRKNIDAASMQALSASNIAVNGSCVVSQDVPVNTSVAAVSGVAKYISDCWETQYVHGANTASLTYYSSDVSGSNAPPAGFIVGMGTYHGTAMLSLANGDYFLYRQKIEGFRIAKLGWGAGGAQAISYAFMFYANVIGVAFVKVSNSDKSRCYYQEFNVSVNGWNFISGTIPGDTAGTWLTTNGIGLQFEVFSSGKAASPVAPGAWGSTNTIQTTNSTNVASFSSDTTGITGLFIKAGTQLVTTQAMLATLMRPYAEELPLCQRYFETDFPFGVIPADNVQKDSGVGFTYGSGAFISPSIRFYVRKRAVPTITPYSSNAKVSPAAGQWQYYNGSAWTDASASTTSSVSATVDNFQIQFGGNGTANMAWLIGGSWKADARL
jgi:hypothetical protein